MIGLCSGLPTLPSMHCFIASALRRNWWLRLRSTTTIGIWLQLSTDARAVPTLVFAGRIVPGPLAREALVLLIQTLGTKGANLARRFMKTLGEPIRKSLGWLSFMRRHVASTADYLERGASAPATVGWRRASSADRN